MVRSICSVLAGYVAMVAVVMFGFALLMTMGVFEDADNPELPSLPWLLLILVLGLVGGILGGWVTVRIANRAYGKHLASLMLFMLLMWVVASFGEQAHQEPLWMRFGNLIVGLTGTLIGGNWCLRSKPVV